MSLEENRKKIGEEYVHCAFKVKNSLALKQDSKILDELGLEFDDVCGFKFCVHGFPHIFLKYQNSCKKNLVYLIK